MKSITVSELAEWRERGVEHTLIDIREPYEREVSHLDGLHIPMGICFLGVARFHNRTPW